MIAKLFLAGTLAVPTAYYVHDTESFSGQIDGEVSLSREIESLREEFSAFQEWSQQAIEDAEAKALRAENRVEELTVEVDEYWHSLHQRGHGPSCTPSRDYLARYRRIQEHGSENRAQAMLDRMFEIMGHDNDEYNQFAWHLMTKKRFAGKYDDLALEVAREMQSQPGDLDHQMIDTIALALFKNGFVAEAIEHQRRAISEGGRQRDYVERLEMYEAARKPQHDSLLVKVDAASRGQ